MAGKVWLAMIAGIICLAVPLTASAKESGLVGLHKLRKERGKICMSGHYHFGRSGFYKSKRKAMREAAGSWSGFTEFEYGAAWGRFRRANSKSITCNRLKETKLWTCEAKARPCKLRTSRKWRKRKTRRRRR